ncbi:MAG: helix-turn-helix domain-containing protein [Bryobacteraceae bacterium]
MNQSLPRQKPRPRRIAADEAHAWARNLRLGNPHAKLILSMVTLYVDGDGFCFVSIPALAFDTELSAQTVRSRLAWLEEIGVIARVPQWVDERGHRNSEARGRRTSDTIRLLIDIDAEQIEARAKRGQREHGSDDDEEADPTPVTLSRGIGSGMPEDSADPALTLRRPYDSAEGLISEPEPEPESPPKAPSGGVCDDDKIQEEEQIIEPEHFAEFWRGYPGHEVMSRYRALEIFVTMKPDEQAHARAAALAHAEMLAKLKRRPKDAHKWLAERGWQEYPQAKLQTGKPATERRLIRGRELEAACLAMKIAGLRPPSLINTTSEETGKTTESTFWARPIGPDLLALVQFAHEDPSSWELVTEGSKEFAAWRERLQAWIGSDVQGDRIWLEAFDPNIHGLPGSHPDFRLRKSTKGFRVPMSPPWPPKKDGTIYTDDNGGNDDAAA